MNTIGLEDLTVVAQAYVEKVVKSEEFYLWLKRKEDLLREEWKVPKPEWEQGYNTVLAVFRKLPDFESSEAYELLTSKRTYQFKVNFRQMELQYHRESLEKLFLSREEYRKTVKFIRKRMGLERT